MKNIIELLMDIGIEVPEDKRTAFEKAVLENYKTSADYEKQKAKLEQAIIDRDAHKASLDGVQTQLAAFEGVDLEKLKGEINTLKGDLKAQGETHKADLMKRDRMAESEKFFREFPKKWANDATREYYAAKLDTLLDGDAAKGKSRAELLDTIIKSEKGEYLPGIFQEENPNPALVVPPLGAVHQKPDAQPQSLMEALQSKYRKDNAQ